MDVLVLGVVIGVVLVACSGDGSDQVRPTMTTPASTETTTYGGWAISESDAGWSIDAGAYAWSVNTGAGLRLLAGDLDGGDGVMADAEGLFVVRDGERQHTTAVTDAVPGSDHMTFAVTFADDSTGTVELGALGGHGAQVRVTVDDPTGVTAWGSELALADDELIYGLSERIVDDWTASETVPEEVASLDRWGEDVSMYITPTMSGYVPFHQSSRGYGLLVDGFMPGRYAIGTSDPEVLSFEFEVAPHGAVADELILPTEPISGSYSFFYGPDHPTIVQQYYEATGYPLQPPDGP